MSAITGGEIEVSHVPLDMVNYSLTQVLDILVGSQHQCTLLLGPRTQASPISLVDDDAIGGRCSHKGKAIRELRPSGVEVEGDVGEGVAKDAQEEGQMSAEY